MAGLETSCLEVQEEVGLDPSRVSARDSISVLPQVRGLKEKVRAVDTKLKQLGSSLTLGEATRQLEEVLQGNKVLEERLEKLENNQEVGHQCCSLYFPPGAGGECRRQGSDQLRPRQDCGPVEEEEEDGHGGERSGPGSHPSQGPGQYPRVLAEEQAESLR